MYYSSISSFCQYKSGSVTFSESCKRGLGFKLVVTCEICVYLNTTVDSNPLINGHALNINRRLTFAMRLIGIGIQGISKFCDFMCHPKPVFSSLYGFASLIGWFSGEVIDICVKSKYCKECEYWDKKKGITEYEE